MLLLKGGGSTPARVSLVGIALVGLGVVILLSGVALLLLVAVAGAALGGAVVLFRKVTGRPVFDTRRTAPGLEVDADYEIRPAKPDDSVERRPDRLID